MEKFKWNVEEKKWFGRENRPESFICFYFSLFLVLPEIRLRFVYSMLTSLRQQSNYSKKKCFQATWLHDKHRHQQQCFVCVDIFA